MGHLCDADYNIIKNWRWESNITGNYDEYLTVQGWNDEKFLAKQFQRILPNVLDNVYSSDKFLVNTKGVINSNTFCNYCYLYPNPVPSHAHATNRGEL